MSGGLKGGRYFAEIIGIGKDQINLSALFP